MSVISQDHSGGTNTRGGSSNQLKREPDFRPK